MTQQGVLVKVAYDGTSFAGWALAEDQRTVEDVLRGAILALDPKGVGPRGTSRTDARGCTQSQMAAFDAEVPDAPRGLGARAEPPSADDVAVREAGVSWSDCASFREQEEALPLRSAARQGA